MTLTLDITAIFRQLGNTVTLRGSPTWLLLFTTEYVLTVGDLLHHVISVPIL